MHSSKLVVRRKLDRFLHGDSEHASCWLRSSAGASMSPVPDNPFIVSHRELEEDKTAMKKVLGSWEAI
jgi:hypothetical protein